MEDPDSSALLGVWWYNEGKNYYKISRSDDARGESKVVYSQTLPGGTQLSGEIGKSAEESVSWSHTAVLSNGAQIRFSIQGEELCTSYKRAGTGEWRTPVEAKRGPEENQILAVEVEDGGPRRYSLDGRAYTKAEFVHYFGGTEQWELAPSAEATAPPKQMTSRGEKQDHVNQAAVLTHLRRTVLDVLMDDEDDTNSILMGASPVRKMLLKALPPLSDAPKRVFDILLPMPLTQKINEETVDRVNDEQKDKPDLKRTITPVPIVQFMPDLAHPVSFNEEQMLRLFVGDPRNSAYNLIFGQRVQLSLTPMQLEYSHALIINRHDVLRSAYKLDGTDPLRTVAQENQGPNWVLVVRDSGDMNNLSQADYMTGHMLGVTPIRSYGFSSHMTTPGMFVNMHHIVADADGLGLYINEHLQISMMLGAGFSEDAVEDRLPKLPVQFVDFSYWQKSLYSQGLLESDLAYWTHQINGTSPPMVLDVPIDKPRPRAWVVVGSSNRLILDQELTMPLSKVSGRATPFAVTFTNFVVALSKLSGNPDSLVAVPFALRSLPELTNLIGNFLNMMPVRVRHGPGDIYKDTLERVAVSAVDVQKYSLAPFITLVDATQKYYAMQDPSRNPVYATMIDLVPNSNEDPSTGLSGVLDVFLFVNTRSGLVWSLDAVYNTFILEQQTVRMMLLQVQAITYQAARSAKEPLPKYLDTKEQVESKSNGDVLLTHVHLKMGFLPQVVGVQSGWAANSTSKEYNGISTARRFKHQSALEVMADYPPEKMASLRPPGGAPAKKAPSKKVEVPGQLSKVTVQAPRAMTDLELAEETEARKAELSRRKARSYEVAARFAKTQRQTETIPLDGPSLEADPYATQLSEQKQWHERNWSALLGDQPQLGQLLGPRARKRAEDRGLA